MSRLMNEVISKILLWISALFFVAALAILADALARTIS